LLRAAAEEPVARVADLLAVRALVPEVVRARAPVEPEPVAPVREPVARVREPEVLDPAAAPEPAAAPAAAVRAIPSVVARAHRARPACATKPRRRRTASCRRADE